MIVYKLGLISENKPALITDLSFYKEVFLSGLSLGFVIIIPFIFRGGLTQFEDGAFALAGLSFKINDLMVASVLIPLISILSRRKKLQFRSGFLFSFLLPILMSFIFVSLANFLADYFELDPQKLDVIELSLYSSIFIAPSIFLSMYFVSIAKSKISFTTGLICLLILLKMGNSFLSLVNYFYFFYCLFLLFIFIHLLYLLIYKYKSLANG